MGRGKLSTKLIEHEKARATTLKKRMKGLKKKAYEFSILCDVKVCMIIFEPKLKDTPARVEVWPSDPIQVKTIIDKYKIKAATDAQKKIFSIFDFFNLRKRQVHDEVAQVRRANFRSKFPTWDDRIDNFSPEQIASFLTKLDLNLEVVKRKIMLMKGYESSYDQDHDHLLQSSSKSRTLGGFNTQSQSNPCDNCIPAAAFLPKNLNPSDNHIQAFPQRNLESGVAKPLNIQLPSLSPADEALVKLSLSLNPIDNSMNPIDKSLRMSMMNNLDFIVQSGIASSSSSSIQNNARYNPPLPPSFSARHDPRIGMPNNNVMFNPPSIPDLHDPRSTSMLNNVMFNEPKVTHNREESMMPRHLFPQMHPSHQFTDSYHDIYEYYEMKNKKQRF